MPHFSRSLRKGGDFFAESKGICFPEFFRSPFQPRRQVVLVYSPSARSRGPPDSTFRAMSHFPHPSSAGAEYFSPASERWVEISHDRALQGRHNHALWLRFRVFFAKAGRQSSPRASLPKRRDLCHLARFALKGHRSNCLTLLILVLPVWGSDIPVRRL